MSQIILLKKKLLNDLNLAINLTRDAEELTKLKKDFDTLQNDVNGAASKLKIFKERLYSNIHKVFQIESHIVFINQLFDVTADGTWVKKAPFN